MLEVQSLTKQFGGLTAVKEITATFEQGKINAIIGPNGAGKTTFFNLISGFHRPTSGRIMLEGRDVAGLRPDRMAKLGIGRTFQATSLFDQATVIDNLIVGHRLRTQSTVWDVVTNFEASAERRTRVPVEGRRGAGFRRAILDREPPRRRHLAGGAQAHRLRAGTGDRAEDRPPRRTGWRGESDETRGLADLIRRWCGRA